jgi:hypothetical protein
MAHLSISPGSQPSNRKGRLHALGQPPTAMGKGPLFLTGCSPGKAGNSSLPEGAGQAKSSPARAYSSWRSIVGGTTWARRRCPGRQRGIGRQPGGCRTWSEGWLVASAKPGGAVLQCAAPATKSRSPCESGRAICRRLPAPNDPARWKPVDTGGFCIGLPAQASFPDSTVNPYIRCTSRRPFAPDVLTGVPAKVTRSRRGRFPRAEGPGDLPGLQPVV